MSTSTELWSEGESPLLSVVQMREAVAPNLLMRLKRDWMT
jgi:hypothetical protein